MSREGRCVSSTGYLYTYAVAAAAMFAAAWFLARTNDRFANGLPRACRICYRQGR